MDSLNIAIDAHINEVNKRKMDGMSTLQVVMGAVAGIISALGLPALYKYFFGHLSEKHKANALHTEEINEMKEKLTRIVTSVDLLLIVIEHEFEDNESIKSAIQKVKAHLHSEINEK